MKDFNNPVFGLLSPDSDNVLMEEGSEVKE